MAMRPFIVPVLIATGEKCSRRIDAGLAGVGQRPTLGEGAVEKGLLRLTREGDRPDVSGSDTSG